MSIYSMLSSSFYGLRCAVLSPKALNYLTSKVSESPRWSFCLFNAAHPAIIQTNNSTTNAPIAISRGLKKHFKEYVEWEKGRTQYSILCLLTFFDPYIVFFHLTFGKILFY